MFNKCFFYDFVICSFRLRTSVISKHKKVVKLNQKNTEEMKRIIDTYMEYVKNAHQMPIKNNLIKYKNKKCLKTDISGH